MIETAAARSSSLFKTADGKNHLVTFSLVCSLFFLWAFCNGMIDVMDKHFQDYLHLSKSQSAWVQFAHYLGYFLMALPAGWLSSKLGYKGGILSGLLLVALGCFWFIPATKIAAFWAFLLGICIISMGLTFLETIANPYATVLGAPQYAASRINLAQSYNGLGWIAGPPIGGLFFYSESGAAAAHETLWIPYAGIGVGVLLLGVVFFKSNIPDLVGEDAHAGTSETVSLQTTRSASMIYGGMLLNVVILSVAIAMIVAAIASIFTESDSTLVWIFGVSALVFAGAGTIRVRRYLKKMTNQEVWSYPHFSGATVAQFFYVAAQAGIFAFFINYMISEIPPLPEFLKETWLIGGASGSTFREGAWFVTEKGATFLLSIAFGFFILGRFTGTAILKTKPAHWVLGIYGLINAGLMVLVALKLGWISFLAVFLGFFFMSIMFPTIFALGIYGLGEKAKLASSYIVMAIMGGAIIPKLMGWVGDHYNMSLGFLIPMICFLVISVYGFSWSKLSGSDGLIGLKGKGGH